MRNPSSRRLTTNLVLALTLGCGSGTVEQGSPDADAPDADWVEELWPPPESWCQRVAGGAPGARSLALDLSAAHAAIRFLGAEPGEEAPAEEGEEPGLRSCSVVDAALAGALAASEVVSGLVNTYAAPLSTVCAVNASERVLGASSVSVRGRTAVIRPGTGVPALPEGAQAVAVDLRDLPAAPGLDDALAAAVSLALAAPVPGSTRRARRLSGVTDEAVSDANVYENTITDSQDEAIPAAAADELPLALIVGPVTAPAAAELAGTLRLRGRAWLVGHDVLAAVAETRWQGVGGRGLSFRIADLYLDGQRWPDAIPADRGTAELGALLDELPDLGPLPAVDRGADDRPQIRLLDCYRDNPSRHAGLGEVRAALLAAHGTTRMFFPYFHVIDDVIDERLEETLAEAPAAVQEGRRSAGRLIRRFGEALSDGHALVLNYGGGVNIAGVLPVVLDHLGNGAIVVRRSLADELDPGDEILAVNGEPIADWLAEELSRTSAATEGHRRVRTDIYLQNLEHTAGLLLRDPAGETRVEFVDPYPFDTLSELGSAPSLREAGDLGDLGAPEYYHINLSDNVLTEIDEFHAALRAAAGHDGLVLDMRGYPGPEHYEVAMRLIPESFQSPIFRTPEIRLDHREIQENQYTMQPLDDPSFSGPIALLVGPGTVSAAENLSLMLVDAGRVTVVGRQSAGTNGNITAVQLPGRFGFTFTGMEVLHADGSTFHGRGIMPDVEVVPTAADLAAGRDPTLERAIEILRGM